MTSDSVGPLSRPFPLHKVTTAGVDASVEATSSECAALAADLGLPAIHRLKAAYRLTGSGNEVRVVGRLTAEIEQTCGVTLDAFPTNVDESVEVAFASPIGRDRTEAGAEVELTLDEDPPEDLVGDRIDLGAITAEFLALGLDPFPRKPGVVFELPAEAKTESPFAKLAQLRPKDAS